ncbi:MAG: lytic transglycosylase domain-containing protein, partial [Candidatus Cloacimonadaceae bacterium]
MGYRPVGEEADWEEKLRTEAESQGVGDFYPVLRAIVDQESGGDPEAVNPETMATGLMQVMPSDVSDQYGGMFSDRPTSQELLDVGVNIREGVADFKRKLEAAGGDIGTALTNYSGG